MRDYFITKWELWYLVFRKVRWDDLSPREYLQKDTYTLNKKFARTFYHLDDARGVLVIARMKWDSTKETSEKICDSIPEKRIERQSRAEF